MSQHKLSLHNLCPDLTYNILSHLTVEDLCETACVSKQWNTISYDDYLWKRFITAPPGLARYYYLRESAWKAGRAIRLSPISINSNIHALQLLPQNQLLLASLNSFSSSYKFTSRNDSKSIVIRSNFAQLVYSNDKAIDVTTGYDDESCITYIAYIYTNGYLSVNEIINDDSDDSDDSDSDSDDDNNNNHKQHIILYKKIIQDGRRLTKVAILAKKKMIIFGTFDGWIGIINIESEEIEMKRISNHSILAISMNEEAMILIGSDGGEVISIDINEGIGINRNYIGPCSCSISSVSSNNIHQAVIVAGIKHRVPGNGHRAAAVAWDARQGYRLAAFGRGGERSSSSAFPTEAVTSIRMDQISGKRVALLVGDVVRVYQIGRWTCDVEIKFGTLTQAMDMDGGRLVISCDNIQEDERSTIHLLDFEQAIRLQPYQVESFEPQLEIRRDYWK